MFYRIICFFFPSLLQSLVGGQDGPQFADLQGTSSRHTQTHKTRRKLESLWLDNNLPLGELAQPLGTSLWLQHGSCCNQGLLLWRKHLCEHQLDWFKQWKLGYVFWHKKNSVHQTICFLDLSLLPVTRSLTSRSVKFNLHRWQTPSLDVRRVSVVQVSTQLRLRLNQISQRAEENLLNPCCWRRIYTEMGHLHCTVNGVAKISDPWIN